MIWTSANSECAKFDSMMLRIYDDSVKSDVGQLLANTNDTRWWTGLNNIATPQVYVWDVGLYATQVDDPSVFSWIHEPDDTSHLQNCVTLNIQGSIEDESCLNSHRYICEYPMPTAGSCMPSWTNFSGSCYLFPLDLGDPWSMLTWQDANTKCQTILQGFSDATGITPHLLFIETQPEKDYISNQLPAVDLTSDVWWIGLTDNQTEGIFQWTDGRLVGMLAYWANEPNNLGAKEQCVYTNSNGSIADFNCNNTLSYICQKENDVQSAVIPGLGCPASWTRAGKYCYHFETVTQHSWSDAKGACGKYGANLIKVDDFDKKTWLEGQNSVFNSGMWYWTGLNYQSNKQWAWGDGTAADLSLVKWNVEPNNYKGNEACSTILRKGTFNDVNCLIKAGYICEQNTEDSPCKTGWLSLTVGDVTNCYYIGTSLVTYDEAHAKCKTQSSPFDSFLLAVNSQAELDFVRSAIKATAGPAVEFYTGLTDIDHEGIWLYDTSWNPAPDSGLIPWSQAPDFPNGNENCATVIFAGEYINVACTDKHPYICERPAYGVQVNSGTRLFTKGFSVSSVFVLMMYFLIYGVCLHYCLHVTYVLFPAFA
ncbi:C-type mannose receptor 2-like isoform X2 [Dreissena polymorpha]|nr:C-type mannose receptor 2-like isoform X2 [Dreissena polymorpha]